MIEADSRLRLDDVDRLIRLDRTGQALASTGRPPQLDRTDVIGVTKAEIERQVALGEVSRLAVAHLQHAASGRERDGDLCTEPVAVRARAAQPDLEEVDGMSLRQIADQHLR